VVRLPGIGEVTGAIMLTASFAAAASILFVTFQERADEMEWAADIRTESALRLAAELVAIGPARCGDGFLFHNYSPHPLTLDDVSVYGASAGRTYAVDVSYVDLAGAPIHVLEGGRSAWAQTKAPCPLVMVTPAGAHIRVGD
jgi:hypothetical protein